QAFHPPGVAYTGPRTSTRGDRDPMAPPSHIHGSLAALPPAGIHVWAGAGHYLQRDRPEDLAVVVESAPCAPRVSARSRNEDSCFSAARVRQLTPRTSRNSAAMAHGAPRRGGELWTSPALGRGFPRRRSVDVWAVSRS